MWLNQDSKQDLSRAHILCFSLFLNLFCNKRYAKQPFTHSVTCSFLQTNIYLLFLLFREIIDSLLCVKHYSVLGLEQIQQKPMLSVWESLVIICRKPCIGDTNSKRFPVGERGSRGTLRKCGRSERFIGKVTNAIDRLAKATAWWGLQETFRPGSETNNMTGSLKRWIRDHMTEVRSLFIPIWGCEGFQHRSLKPGSLEGDREGGGKQDV